MGDPRASQSCTLAPRWWRTLAVAVVILLVVTTASEAQNSGDRGRRRNRNRLQRCQQPPRFSVDGVEPMVLARGKVTLVALLINTCSFCIQQSEKLAVLHRELNGPNDEGVNMMIVDAGTPPQQLENGVFERRVNFSVYYDDSRHTIWRHVFKGNKDDILIFNECGMLTYHIRFPYSFLGYNYVRRAIRNTASGHLCPQCRRSDNRRAPQDRMQADAPMPGRTHGALESFLNRIPGRHNPHHFGGRQGSGRNGKMAAGLLPRLSGHLCPGNDRLCRELRRGRRRYNRFLAAHGFTRHDSRTNEERILDLLGRRRHAPAFTAL